MPYLKLPSTAPAILSSFQHNPNFQRSQSKLPVYSIPGIAQQNDLEALCHIDISSYLENEGEGEDPTEVSFLSPAPAACLAPGEDVQEILERHVEFFSSSQPFAGDGGDGSGDGVIDGSQIEEQENCTSLFLPSAFIVVEDPNWLSNGVTLVFCHREDDDKGDHHPQQNLPSTVDPWRVDECEISLPALAGVCRDLVLDLEEWSVIENCVGRPTRRTGSRRYLAERDGRWSPVGISGSMARGW